MEFANLEDLVLTLPGIERERVRMPRAMLLQLVRLHKRVTVMWIGSAVGCDVFSQVSHFSSFTDYIPHFSHFSQ